MKSTLKQLLAHIPAADALAYAVSNRIRLNTDFGALRSEVKKRLYPNGGDCVVQTGPFQGLRYFDRHVWGILTNKWLGSYEVELSGVIQHILATPYRIIYDIGCAEGWYVVGLAVRMPEAQVVAFDTDPISRHQCQVLARLNGVCSRVKIRRECDFPDLHALSTLRSLVICDIEGAETHLLDPVRAPALGSADILVEVHESSAASHDVENTLRCRFAATHAITHIAATDRSAWLAEHGPRFAASIPEEMLCRAVQEHRAPGNGWLWMIAHPWA